jgi:hypothetical protein
MRKLSEKERILVEFVHILAYGDKLEFGLTLSEVLEYLERGIPKKRGLNTLECIDRDGEEILRELKAYLAERKR